MKIKHLKRSCEFAEILTTGGRERGRTLAFYLLPHPVQGEIQVGTIIAKKNVPKAVRRNYIRRVIYSYFRENLEKIKNSRRVVVRVIQDLRADRKRPLARLIREDLEKLSRKSGIIQ